MAGERGRKAPRARGLAGRAAPRRVAGERGQASVEWVALVGLVALASAAAAGALVAVDGRSLGALLAHRLTCAVERDCSERYGGDALVRAYGERDAALVRRHLPGLVFEPGERQLPVDWRRCREVECATVDDEGDRDAHRSAAGRRATLFTRLLEDGDRRYVQYWAYYPDSNTTFGLLDRVAQMLAPGADGPPTFYPGWHRDDWEGVAVRVEPDGGATTRVTDHKRWTWCKLERCEGDWGPATGWTRVSRGSHAGHVPVDTSIEIEDRVLGRGEVGHRRRRLLPGAGLSERTATPDAIRVVPIETLDRDAYRRLDEGIAPPWEKEAYSDPLADGS